MKKAVTSSEAATGGVPTTSGSFESSHATRFPPSRAGLLSESERWISCRDGFRFEMNRRMFSVNLVNYDTENRNV